jgi:hypothetical protein
MVRNVILKWYDSTSEHVPVEDFEHMLSEDVEMLYFNRSEPFVGRAAFREWYADVLNRFFDEVHEVEAWNIELHRRRAIARVVTRWEARSWTVGEPYSKYEGYLTHQLFEIERSEVDGRVEIKRKIVESAQSTTPIYGTNS